MNVLLSNRRPTLFALALLLVALLLAPLLLAEVPQPTTPEQVVDKAWALARQSGSYHFHTSIDQQTIARPSLRNAGRPPRHDYFTMDGTVDQPAERLELSLWRSRTPDPDRAVSVK